MDESAAASWKEERWTEAVCSDSSSVVGKHIKRHGRTDVLPRVCVPRAPVRRRFSTENMRVGQKTYCRCHTGYRAFLAPSIPILVATQTGLNDLLAVFEKRFDKEGTHDS
jgi:hypothetical protein